jgi:hypothetical protein
MDEVYTSGDYIEAQILFGLLRSRGVDTTLHGAALQGGLGELPALGILRLTVAAADGNRARQLLLDYYAGALQLDSSNVQDFK